MAGWRTGVKIDMARWRRVRQQVFARDGRRCVDCGRPGRLECDHIVALFIDPTQDFYAIEGLATRCRGCHLSKSMLERGGRPDPERAALEALLAQELRDIPQ